MEAIRKRMKPGVCLAAALAAVSCALLAVDCRRVLDYSKAAAGARNALPAVLWVLCGLGAAYALLYLFFRPKDGKEAGKAALPRDKRIREWMIYLCVIVLITLGLFILFRGQDLSAPIVYTSGDEMGIYALAKSIIRNGTTLITPEEGGLAGGDMFDYPYSDKLSFLWVRLIGLVIHNPYTVVTLFYFLNHYLAALTATWACRKMKVSPPLAVAAGILFAFTPYMQQRFSHMWLTAYYMLPIACLIAIWIVDGKPFEEQEKLRGNRVFRQMAGLSFACAFTGIYYAFFACVLYAAATVIHFFREKERKFSRIFYPALLVCAVAAGVMVNVLPNFLYWSLNGMNPESEVAKRKPEEMEVFALKLARLLLPRDGHRHEALRNIMTRYTGYYPLNNENNTNSLGMVASVGLIMSIIMLLSRRKEYHTVSALNISTLLVGTVGGIGAWLGFWASVWVSVPIRCFNRSCMVILFMSLLMDMMILDNVVKKHRKAILPILSAAMMVFGFWDQTVPWATPDLNAYHSASRFIDRVEEELEPGDSVFTLPYDDWPTTRAPGGYLLHIGYIESEGLHWSYGAMQGREEARHQDDIVTRDTQSIIEMAREDGYDGIYMDRNHYIRLWGMADMELTVEELTAELGEPINSDDMTMSFWKIGKETNP